ncbi:MAG: CsgG/HfaB family protein [Treponematales bacterium]
MKLAVLGFSLSILILSCASVPVRTAPQSAQTTSEDTVPQILNTALHVGVDYLSGRMPSNAKVAVVSAYSPTENLSNYIIDTAIMHLVNKDKLTVIKRSEIGALQKKQMYQASGEVSDETAVSIGHQLGVQVIITGAIIEIGDKYSLLLKALDVEAARILGTQIYHVKRDQTLTALLRPSAQSAKTLEKVEAPKEPPKQTVIQGNVNITTNNNTTINGDVYVNKPDWFNPDKWGG